MFIIPIACILIAGCGDSIPFERIRTNNNSVSINVRPYSDPKRIKYYEKGKACYRNGVFSPTCEFPNEVVQ